MSKLIFILILPFLAGCASFAQMFSAAGNAAFQRSEREYKRKAMNLQMIFKVSPQSTKPLPDMPR